MKDDFILTSETVECPDGTVKCPGSYCIPVRFVCDGETQCPGKQDEEDCGKLHVYLTLFVCLFLCHFQLFLSCNGTVSQSTFSWITQQT